jgi:hypothetical protein
MRCSYRILEVILFFKFSDSLQPSPSRRILLERVGLISFGVTSSFLPEPSNAIQGAAEYDLEYYMRDLFQGNPKEGTRSASQIPQAPAQRTLTSPLQPLDFLHPVQGIVESNTEQ